MTPERWQQIEEIFHEALDLDAAERSKFIKKKAGKDEELKAEVEKLLLQFDDASSFIEQPLYNSAKTGFLSHLLDDSDEDPMVGKLLGSYRIEREIGRGGMGAVYEAYRADGEFRLRVGLKVVKRGIDTDFVLKRFRNERQILAALDHPFITRLIDGGTTDDGRPYFVMEFIDGLPLYRHCDKQRLSINERLALFCRICEAVEYAHQKLVIHRDLKPSNIFIATDGSPRLLDFGIAKLLDPEMALDTLQPTATALRMMTVDYASPEQVRGEKVTFATDIYSLGVILFELLTGHRPYKIASRSPHDVARAICDDEPSLPSSAITGGDGVPVVRVNPSAPTLTGVADLRSESPANLSKQLQGNLDNIIMKALRKVPEDRYESVAAFRDDIERHLKGEDVAVKFQFHPRPKSDSASESDSKLVAVLPLSLMGPAGTENTDEAYLTVGLADAIITRLTSVRKLTVRPTSSITRYNEHLINPFRAGLELGVDFVLDGRIRRFGERLRISLQLLDVKKGSAIWAGQFDERLTDVLELEDAISEQVAAALIPQLTGEDKEKLAKRGTNDPLAYEAYLKGRFYWNQFTAQSFPKAIEAFEKAIAIDPQYALAYVGIADFYIWANIYGLVPVRESYEHANAAARRALEIDDQLGEAYASLGLLVANQYDLAGAEKLQLKAIELIPNYPLVHEWYSALLVTIGRFDEGVAEIRRAVELDPLSLRTKVLHVWTLYQVGDLNGALVRADEIISLDETYPQGHLQRGYVLSELGRGNEAVKSIERGMELMPGSSLAQYYLAFALASAGRRSDALVLAQKMKETAKTEYIKPMFLGLAFLAAGQTDEAFGFLETAVAERDPWLFWFGTDAKFKPFHDDPRYQELLRRTRGKRIDGHAQISQGNFDAHTSIGFSEIDTVPMADSPTGAFTPGFLRRHVKKLSIASAAVALITLGYLTGFINFEFRADDRRQANVVSNRSIAVLPFENATGDPGNDYISEGMSDTLITRISSAPEIRAVPRSAVSAYRSQNLDPRAIGRDLSVESVLTGTLRRQSEEYVLMVEMTSVADGRKQLSMSFAEKPANILSMQDKVWAKVVEALNLKPATTLTAQRSYTANNDAFQAYLKGEYSRQKGSPAGTTDSIELYKKAIEIDPNYALAYQGLALAYRSAPAYGAMSPQEAFSKAKDAAQKALSLDPSLAAAYVSLASIKATYDWDFAGAETEYRLAIQLAPNNSEAHYSYGNFLVAMGRSDEALIEFRNALQIDPLSLNIQTNIGWANYIAGRYDEAAAQVRQVIDRDPTFARAHMNLGEILQEQGKNDEAIAEFQKARDLSKDPLAEMALGHAYATAGRNADALKIATDLEEKARQKQVSAFLPAVVYAGLNEKDRSFYWLERAYQERSNWLTLIKVGRRLKNLRGDPRFDDLLKRVGFPG